MIKVASYEIVFQEIPDEVTLALNISNCPNRCKGCHSPQLMNDIGEPLNEEMLGGLLEGYGNQVTCICFMGGDAEPLEVQRIAKVIRSKKPDLKIGWYSGKPKLHDGIDISNFNYIKIGGYKEEFGALKSETTNQRMYKIVDGKMEDITYRFWKK